MHYKNIIKILSITTFTTLSLAKQITNECDKFRDLLKINENVDGFSCKTNDDGRAIEIDSERSGIEESNMTAFLKELPNFTELEYFYMKGVTMIPDNIGNLTKLKTFNLDRCSKEIEIPKSIENLESLEDITIWRCKIKSNGIPKELGNLKNLKTIEFTEDNIKDVSFLPYLKNVAIINLSNNEIKEVPSFENLRNLEEINLSNNNLTKIPKSLEKAENLSSILLNNNSIDDEIPETLNSLKHLKKFWISDNKNIKGKTLTNNSLTECVYGNYKDLCIEKDMDCFNDSSDNKPKSYCDATINDKVSTDHRCGKGKGKCPAGECCSKYGWCGNSEKHCSAAAGCQSEFGECNLKDNNKCGGKNGKCPSGKCCGKNGKCGTTDSYCLVKNGCQSEFGECKSDKISTNGRCGLEFGSCPSGKCCSKYGYCGSSKDHCSIANGCQSLFGKCEQSNYVKGRCGKNYGSCPSGQCCSGYGYCGVSNDYCGNRCQSEFGRCN